MHPSATPIARPGHKLDQTPFELLSVDEESDVSARWRKDMERIAESERAVEEDAGKIHIR